MHFGHQSNRSSHSAILKGQSNWTEVSGVTNTATCLKYCPILSQTFKHLLGSWSNLNNLWYILEAGSGEPATTDSHGALQTRKSHEVLLDAKIRLCWCVVQSAKVLSLTHSFGQNLSQRSSHSAERIRMPKLRTKVSISWVVFSFFVRLREGVRFCMQLADLAAWYLSPSNIHLDRKRTIKPVKQEHGDQGHSNVEGFASRAASKTAPRAWNPAVRQLRGWTFQIQQSDAN